MIAAVVWASWGAVWASEARDAGETPVSVPVDAEPAPEAPVPAGGVMGGRPTGGLGGLVGARAADAPAPGMPGRITVSTTWRNPVMVAEVLGQSVGHGYGYVGGQAGSTTVITTYLTDRCQTPCTLAAAPGVLNLITHGGGALGARAQVIVQPGSSQHVTIKAQPLWTRWLSMALTGVGAGLLGAGAAVGPAGLYDPTPAEVAQAKATQIGLLTAGGVAFGGGLGVLFGVRSRAIVTPEVPVEAPAAP